MPSGEVQRRPLGTDVVAIILAIGISTATNLFTLAVLYDALFGHEPGLSENATQVLTGWGGGIIGVIGAASGAYVANKARERTGLPTTETTSLPVVGE